MSELKFKVIKGKKRVAYEMVYRDFWQWCYANARYRCEYQQR